MLGAIMWNAIVLNVVAPQFQEVAFSAKLQLSILVQNVFFKVDILGAIARR
jgi:hypothetical protein